MKDFEAKTSPKKKMDTESWFIECYRNNQGHPLRTLMHLYKGNYHKFVMAVICFFAKHACVWVLPIITANIINDVTAHNPDTFQNIIFYSILEAGLILLNIPMNYLYPLCGDRTSESTDPEITAAVHFLSCGDPVRTIAVQDHARCGSSGRSFHTVIFKYFKYCPEYRGCTGGHYQ